MADVSGLETSLFEAMSDGELDGMQHFDGELEKLVTRGGSVINC